MTVQFLEFTEHIILILPGNDACIQNPQATTQRNHLHTARIVITLTSFILQPQRKHEAISFPPYVWIYDSDVSEVEV